MLDKSKNFYIGLRKLLESVTVPESQKFEHALYTDLSWRKSGCITYKVNKSTSEKGQKNLFCYQIYDGETIYIYYCSPKSTLRGLIQSEISNYIRNGGSVGSWEPKSEAEDLGIDENCFVDTQFRSGGYPMDMDEYLMSKEIYPEGDRKTLMDYYIEGTQPSSEDSLYTAWDVLFQYNIVFGTGTLTDILAYHDLKNTKTKFVSEGPCNVFYIRKNGEGDILY